MSDKNILFGDPRGYDLFDKKFIDSISDYSKWNGKKKQDKDYVSIPRVDLKKKKVCRFKII